MKVSRMNCKIVHLGIVLVSFVANISCQLIEYTPVVFWSHSIVHKNVPALQYIETDQFRSIMQMYLKEKPYVIVFEDEELSVEDLSLHHTSGVNIFESLNRLLQTDGKHKVSYLPAVQSPALALNSLSKKSKHPITASGIRAGTSRIPKPVAGHFLFVELDESESAENRISRLQQNVESMSEIYQMLHEQYKDILVVYTARRPAWYARNVSSRKIRELRQGDVSNVTSSQIPAVKNQPAADTPPGDDENIIRNFTNANMILRIAESPILVVNDEEKILNGITISPPILNETHMSLNLASVNGSFTMVFRQKSGYWYLDNLVITNVQIATKTVFAPFGFSYHCSKMRVASKDRTIKLLLQKIQFQPNFNENITLASKFGDAYDCVGFTSIGIWAGLFVTFILGLIIMMGLCMMMDIRTMDRFDDPKGKTITVTTGVE